MQAEAKDALGDEAGTGAVRAVQEDADLTKLRGGDRKVIEVVLDVVIGAIEGRSPPRGGTAEHSHVSHNVLQSRLNLFGPLGRVAAPIGWGDRVGPR